MKTIHGVQVLTTIEELVDPSYTAMIVIDMQNGAGSERGKHATEKRTDTSPNAAIIPNIQRLLDAARRVGVSVLFSRGGPPLPSIRRAALMSLRPPLSSAIFTSRLVQL